MKKIYSFCILAVALFLMAALIAGCSAEGSGDNIFGPQGTSTGTGTITGVLTDAISGDPIEGAVIAVGSTNTTTAADGSYTLTDIPEGSNTLTGTADEYLDYSATVVVAKDTTTTYNFQMTKIAPAITSITPNNGNYGDQVTIVGTNFGDTQGTSTVTFSGVPANVVSWSNTQIVVTVPYSGTGDVIVTVGSQASNAITFTYNPASFLAVCLRGTGEIGIIDLSDMSITRHTVGDGPFSIAITPDKQYFYVTDSPGGETGQYVRVVRVSDGTVVTSIDVGGSPWGVAVHPDGSKVYVAVQTEDEIAVIDTATNTITNTITVGGKPGGIAISPNGNILGVPNHSDDTISFINTATETVAYTSAAFGTSGGEPWECTFTPDSNTCYVTDGDGGDTVFAFRMSDYSRTPITMSVTDGSTDPAGIAAAPNGSMIVVAMNNSTNLNIINPATDIQSQSITTSTSDTDRPKRVVVDFDSSRVFYSSDGDDIISIVDLINNVESSVINFDSGDRPNGMILY